MGRSSDFILSTLGDTEGFQYRNHMMNIHFKKTKLIILMVEESKSKTTSLRNFLIWPEGTL